MEDVVLQMDSTPQQTCRHLLRLHIILIATICLMLVILILHSRWLPAFYRFLDVSQPPHSADVIVVLGGSGGPRETYAVSLYRQGYTPKILVSGSLDIDYSLDLVKKEGVPVIDIIVNDQATTTYNEAEQVLALLLEMKATSALVVTDRFHTRRAAATYHHVFQGYDINLTFVSPDDHVDANDWWNSRIRDQVMTEYLKMFYYAINYGVLPW